MTVVKRFIAGAVCPRCNQMDTLRMYRDDEREYRECVKCDFTDAMRLDGQPEAEELETRVNRTTPELSEDVQPLLFHPNPGLQRNDH
ncbi:MAG: YheV family putative metal-binding protein [Marinobacterium sp.]|nr:YheV family putative metal-binding protein [Marinobacterium sp.]